MSKITEKKKELHRRVDKYTVVVTNNYSIDKEKGGTLKRFSEGEVKG